MMQKNTPPTSPGMEEQPNEEEVEEEDIVEVIELGENDEDEGLEDDDVNNSGDEDDRDFDDMVGSTDDADFIFTKHTGSVFACALDPKTGHVALTGGEDDKAYVWNTTTGDVILECSGHKDSVICTAFSHDGAYAATGDMSGIIQVWKMSTKTLTWSYEVGDLSWLGWHHGSHVLLAGTTLGETWMWRIPNGDCKTFPGHGERNECGVVMPDGKRTVLGYSDGSLKIFDLKTAKMEHHLVGSSVHSGIVTCIDTHQDNTLVLSGSTDGTAKLFNSHTGKLLATFLCIPEAASEESGYSVEAVTFCPDKQLGIAATATVEGEIATWDISTQVQRHLCQQESGITKVQWDPSTPILYTAGLDGIVRVFDSRSGNIEGTLGGHTANILDMCLSKDGSTLVTASDDKTSRVFSLHKVDR